MRAAAKGNAEPLGRVLDTSRPHARVHEMGNTISHALHLSKAQIEVVQGGRWCGRKEH